MLGDGDTSIEIVYGEEKNILYWVDQSSQGRIKSLSISLASPFLRKTGIQHLFFILLQTGPLTAPARIP
jgi:hypothetical protein